MQSSLYLSGGADYLILNGGLSQVVTFSPEARVHSLSINITIIDDELYEGDEILCVSLSTSTTNLVDFSPASLTIEENDSETIVLYCITITINYHAIDITIGFNSTTYTVRESDSRVVLCIRVISGEFDDTAIVNVRLNTVSGTADCKQINRHS